jgi:hypothetical protein
LISLPTKASNGIVPTVIEYLWTHQAVITFLVSTFRSNYKSVSLLIKYLVLITVTAEYVIVGINNSNHLFQTIQKEINFGTIEVLVQ